jgi:hypothetical protein
MFRFQKRNSKRNTISKGSEFRTTIALASLDAFCEGSRANRFFWPMNNSFKKSRDIHLIVTGAPLARLGSKSH